MEDYNGQNYFNVIIDGAVVQKLKIDSAKKWYTLAENLSPGEHVAELFKRTQINGEYRRGYTRFYGFSLPGGKALSAPQRKLRRMEFYGNSITCGHAVEDTTGGDSGASFYENNYLSYASLTARHFGAQSSCIAVSGIGLLAGFRKAIMPEIYNLRNPFDSTDVWDFSLYQPQVVVVNLLENDKAVIGRPSDEHFKKRFGNTPPTEDFIISSYASFIKILRKHYPNASIICVLGDMEITRAGSKWPGYVEKAVASLHDKKVYTHFFPYKGTPGHPRVKQQAEMAASLIKFIDQNLKW
ncbi:SGNH/GDSL hydrolase family protein [Flavisolibacter ginsenosidimutans]